MGKDNEARSGDRACRALAQAGADDRVQQSVRTLIMATCHDAQPADPDARLRVDIDFAILGAVPARFAGYVSPRCLEWVSHRPGNAVPVACARLACRPPRRVRGLRASQRYRF